MASLASFEPIILGGHPREVYLSLIAAETLGSLTIGYRHLARLSNLSTGNVRSALKQLRDMGLVSWTPSGVRDVPHTYVLADVPVVL